MNPNLENRLSKKVETDYIKTTGGNAIYKSNEEITVQISPNQFLRKKVEDLNTGERVVFDVYHVRTTLEDVEPHLEKSPLYSKALEIVYDKNSNNENIPKFRVALLSSLVDSNIIQGDNLPRKIMMEGDDFSNQEYEMASRYIMRTVLEAEHREPDVYIPEISSIESWIRGRTIAPRDHRVFGILQQELGSRFSQFVCRPDDDRGFYKNYRIYVVLRQAIMRTLNNWRAIESPDSGDDIRRESMINIAEEINAISSHFLKDITDNLKSVLVSSIEKGISEQREYHIRRSDRILSEGVIRSIIPELMNNTKSYREVLEDYEILEGYFDSAIMKTRLFGNILPIGRTLIAKQEFPYMMRLFREPLDPDLELIESKKDMIFKRVADPEARRGAIETRDRFLEEMRLAILNGELDSDLGYTKGTMNRLIESCFRTRRAIPNAVFEYVVLCKKWWARILTEDKMNPITRKKLKRGQKKFHGIERGDIERFRRYLFENYDLRFNEFGKSQTGGISVYDEMCHVVAGPDIPKPISYAVISRFTSTPESFQRNFSPGDLLYYQIINTPGALENFVKHLEKHFFIRTRNYMKHVLSQYGLENIVELKSKDFILETRGIDFPRAPGF